MNKTVEKILKSDVYGEDFNIAFVSLLEKFVDEYDDMAQMKAIKQARKLLEIINDEI